MTNREKFKDEILDLVCSGKYIAINRRTNEPCNCAGTECIDCAFSNDKRHCKQKFTEWCNAEYVEPCPFEKDELVEVSDDRKMWQLRYFYRIDKNRDSDYGKFLAFDGGKTSEETDSVTGWRYCRKYGTLGGLVK